MSKYSNYTYDDDSNTSLLDFLFISLLIFITMFTIVVTMINKARIECNLKTKAEFVITVTWPSDRPDDVDTWLMNPVHQIVYYARANSGMMHLDRDDRGDDYDYIILPNGSPIKYPYNQEITTIRGIIPGEWILNLHMFKKNVSEPTIVSVSIDKLNPTAKKIFHKEIVLDTHWEETTVARFEMSIHGEIIAFDTETGIDFAQETLFKTRGYTGQNNSSDN